MVSQRACVTQIYRRSQSAVFESSKSTYTPKFDIPFSSPAEVAGQMVQHGASTLPGLPEVRAALPPPLVL